MEGIPGVHESPPKIKACAEQPHYKQCKGSGGFLQVLAGSGGSRRFWKVLEGPELLWAPQF